MTRILKSSKYTVFCLLSCAIFLFFGLFGDQKESWALSRSADCIGFLQSGYSRETIQETEGLLGWLRQKQKEAEKVRKTFPKKKAEKVFLQIQRLIATNVVEYLHQTLGIGARVFEFSHSEDPPVEVGVKILAGSVLEPASHWLTQLAYALQKKGVSLVLDLQREDASMSAWYMDEIKAVGISVSDIAFSVPSATAIHELVHLQHSLDQRARRGGYYTSRQYMPQMSVVTRYQFKDESLRRAYGGDQMHWLEEQEAYLKEARVQLAYARAAWRRYLSAETGPSKAQVLWHLKESQSLLKDVREFYTVDGRTMNLLLRKADQLEVTRDRNQIVLEWKPAGAKTPHVSVAFQFVPGEAPIDSVIRQRKHMDHLAILAKRVQLELKALRAEISAHRSR